MIRLFTFTRKSRALRKLKAIVSENYEKQAGYRAHRAAAKLGIMRRKMVADLEAN